METDGNTQAMKQLNDWEGQQILVFLLPWERNVNFPIPCS